MAQSTPLFVGLDVHKDSPALRAELEQHKPALLALLKPVTDFALLRGGLTVPVPALCLALDLEARGVPLATDANHRFIVPNDAQLTAGLVGQLKTDN
jgi:hypothetical protein